MKICLYLPVVEDPDDGEPFGKTYELASLVEDAGFDALFVGHHHVTPGYVTAPWVLLAAIAARTTRLRLGTSIFLLPMHHPIDVAEQVATLDHISNGRVILGAGIGYRPNEYEAFQLPFRQRASRMDEALEILRTSWTEEAVSYHGRHFRFSEVTVLPKPLQQPHPPIWVGAVARAAQDRAARLGDGWISDVMEPLPREVHLAERYRNLCASAGRPPVVCLMRTAAIAARREDLEERWLPAAAAVQLDYWRRGARSRDDDHVFERLESGAAIDLPSFATNRLIAGTPDDCVTEIGRWAGAVNPDYLLLGIAGPDPGYEATRAAIELFGREVLPAVEHY